MLAASVSKKLGKGDGRIDINVSLEVTKHERIALFGHSGAGKTSLLRMLAGLDRPDSGSIVMNNTTWVDVKNKKHIPSKLRNIGFVFQDYALFPNMTLRQNLQFASERNNAAQWVEELLDITELAPFANQKPSELSGGQKQRGALARAFVRKPQLLLMDEPLSALDRRTRKLLWKEINKIYERFPVTMVLVSHDQKEIHSLTERVIVLDKGKIMMNGNPNQVFNHSNRFNTEE